MTTDLRIRRATLVRLGALVLLTAVALSPVLGAGFVNFDDDSYVTANPQVLGGLTRSGVAWAFTSVGYAGNWHPLTWLSHMLDVTLFGPDPRGHHLTSLLLHVANTAVLCLLLGRLTGAHARGALVAALFAAHPLHVESVAWVSERKDLLAALLGLLSLGAYLWHARRPGTGRLLAVAALLALGLMAKPMLVTLPLLFLVLDFWPLGRLRSAPRALLPLLLEKLPLGLLAAGAAALTWLAQTRGGTVGMGGTAHLPMRLANAAAAYAGYLGKMLWPFGLSVFYPYFPGSFRSPAVIAAALLLLALSAAAVLRVRRSPALAAGWLWYLVSLLPVIGLVQAGMQSLADRYTYLPLIGPFLMLAWGIPELLPQRRPRTVLPAAALLCLALLAARTFDQALVWKDSETLFRHALTVAPQNPVALNNLGSALSDQGREREALPYFREAARLNPADFPPVFNLGRALARAGEPAEAIPHLERALTLAAGTDRARVAYLLGGALLAVGRDREAVGRLEFVLGSFPQHADTLISLGLALERLGRHAEARARIEEARRRDPGNPRLRELPTPAADIVRP